MFSKKLLSSASTLFRESEQIVGTRDFCFSAIKSLSSAITTFSGSKEELREELKNMVYLVKNTSPRISLLMFMFFKIKELFFQYLDENPNVSIREAKQKLKFIIEEVRVRRLQSFQKLIKCSDSVIEGGDVILLHDASHSVFDILCEAQKKNIYFSILLAEREKKKNILILRFLIDNNIDFQVVPEYLLSHVKSNITKAIFGAVTINSLHEVVSDAGTGSIVAQMREWNIPVYVPITNDKFSLWKAKEHHTYKTTKHKISDNLEYDKLSFSHDRYKTDLVTCFITNKGLLSAKELNDMYDQYYKDCNYWRRKNEIDL